MKEILKKVIMAAVLPACALIMWTTHSKRSRKK